VRAEAELKAIRERAADAAEQKTDFLARIGHEIRVPLNAIVGFTDLIIAERFGPIMNERYREYLRDIQVSAQHVLTLVNDLLDLTKVEAAKLDLAFEPTDLNTLAQQCLALMQPEASRRHVILRSSLVTDLPPVAADQRSVKQILLNLLSNALKYNEVGGQVILSTARPETGEVELRVRDTGEGLAEPDLARALEPFRQLAMPTQGSASGSSLNLPLIKALVEANGARFHIQSARGEGTIVKIAFPPGRVLAD